MVTCLYEAEYVVVRVTIVWIFYHNKSICTVFHRYELVCVVLVDDLMRNSLGIVDIGVVWLRCLCLKLPANYSYYSLLHRHWLSKLLQMKIEFIIIIAIQVHIYYTYFIDTISMYTSLKIDVNDVPDPPLPPPPPPTALCRSLACCICIALLCINIYDSNRIGDWNGRNTPSRKKKKKKKKKVKCFRIPISK